MRILTVIALLAALSGCGSADGLSGDTKKIDRDAWRSELVALDGVGADPDLDKLEALTREDCVEDVDALALRYSLSGARPDVARVNMKYICPDQVGKIDEALEQLQDATSEVDEACATEPGLRTEKQSQLAEAMACDG